MTAGFGTIAGSVMGAYMSFGVSSPVHLVFFSVIGICIWSHKALKSKFVSHISIKKKYPKKNGRVNALHQTTMD